MCLRERSDEHGGLLMPIGELVDLKLRPPIIEGAHDQIAASNQLIKLVSTEILQSLLNKVDLQLWGDCDETFCKGVNLQSAYITRPKKIARERFA